MTIGRLYISLQEPERRAGSFEVRRLIGIEISRVHSNRSLWIIVGIGCAHSILFQWWPRRRA